MTPSNSFTKYHALGNDYLVVEPTSMPSLDTTLVQRLCDRHFGAGSDGVLYGPMDGAPAGTFALHIYNPDGSLAEKSGNGLRIFARYLWDTGRVTLEPFTLLPPAGPVRAQVLPGGSPITVEIGHPHFLAPGVPPGQIEQFSLTGLTLPIVRLSLGNPHCVVLQPATPAEAQAWGPQIETHPLFPQRTNVQFLQVRDRSNLQIEIWERGAGYTLASGTSSCAAAAVAHFLGQCDSSITVHMPGGQLQVEIASDGLLTLTGPVTPVFQGAWLQP